MVMSFHHFCIQQQLRLMCEGLPYVDPTHVKNVETGQYADGAEHRLTQDEIFTAYREDTFGPCLDARDRRDGSIHMEYRRGA